MLLTRDYESVNILHIGPYTPKRSVYSCVIVWEELARKKRISHNGASVVADGTFKVEIKQISPPDLRESLLYHTI